MGRYSSAQTFSDGNPNNPQLSYAQAKGGKYGPADGGEAPKAKNARPDRVMNVMGSCAGAGSSEFHHYRNTRRVELDRVARMEAEATQEAKQTEFYKRKLAQMDREEEKTTRKAAKRKRRKQQKKGGQGVTSIAEADEEEGLKTATEKFSYVPMEQQPEIVNDGSFMEKVRQQLESKEETGTKAQRPRSVPPKGTPGNS